MHTGRGKWWPERGEKSADTGTCGSSLPIYLKTAAAIDKHVSHLPLPAPHTQVLFFCTAHNSDARPAIYAVANGGLVEEKKRRIHLLALF